MWAFAGYSFGCMGKDKEAFLWRQFFGLWRHLRCLPRL